MENQPVFEKSMANLLEIHGIRGKSKRIHGIFTDGLYLMTVVHISVGGQISVWL